MKHLAIVFTFSVAFLLFGCGGVHGPAPVSTSTPPTATPPTAPPSGTSATPNVVGDWQFSTASTVPGRPPLTFAGNISQTNSAVGGALHVDGSSCFNPLTPNGLSGTVSANDTSLTFTTLDGQAVTLTGSFTRPTFFYGTVVSDTFTGTYKIDGGCAAGDQGTVTGNYIDSIARQSDPTQLSGTFTSSSAQQKFHVTGNIVQNDSASAEGSFAITGNATFDTPCLGVGAIPAGTYPSGSFILGTSVGLEFDTGNGTLTFLGKLNPDRNTISGNYTVSDGTCNDSGTAVLSASSAGIGAWDY
jgi:hypothetical protein